MERTPTNLNFYSCIPVHRMCRVDVNMVQCKAGILNELHKHCAQEENPNAVPKHERCLQENPNAQMNAGGNTYRCEQHHHDVVPWLKTAHPFKFYFHYNSLNCRDTRRFAALRRHNSKRRGLSMPLRPCPFFNLPCPMWAMSKG